MAIKLVENPTIKLTLNSNDPFEDLYKDFVFTEFRLSKKLLEPNRFEFVMQRANERLETDDIEFQMKSDLFGAKVEVSLKGVYYDMWHEEEKEYEVEDFFYGYIQNLKMVRVNKGSTLIIRCIAYSPDAKLKHHPTCCTFNHHTLEECVDQVLSLNAIEPMASYFKKEEGKYSDDAEGLAFNVNPVNGTNEPMPYTVQYKESPYNFLKRLAKRYAEFMYYENREFVFGDMIELPTLSLFVGADLESYTYELNMNDDNGIVFAQHHSRDKIVEAVGYQKETNTDDPFYESINDQDELENEMSTETLSYSHDYFGDFQNSVMELGSTPEPDFDITSKSNYYCDVNKFDTGLYASDQRENLDHYVMADMVLCYGKANRADLKLGSVLELVEETFTNADKEDWWEHKQLKVIGLTYRWKFNDPLSMANTFKAMPREAQAPPYLERDKYGFLTYGDFDIYPKCGPQYGIVVDNKDPEQLGRVQVSLTWQNTYGRLEGGSSYDPKQDEEQRTPWIWVVSPYQGFQRGAFVIPEIGDQVLVGFEHNNAERPYVMGSRYKKRDLPTDSWTNYDNNNVKAFRTRSGHNIEFIDDDTMTGTGGKIRIYDAQTYAYEITFDTDKNLISLKSKGNIELDADKNIILHAGNDLVINVDHDMKTTVENEQETHVKKKQFTEVTEGPLITFAKDTQTHRSEKDIELLAHVTAEDVDDNLSALTLSDTFVALCLHNGHSSGNKSVIGMNTEQIQVATDWPSIKILVASRQGGDVEIMSDQKNVNIGAGMNVDVEANQSVEIEGKAQTSVSGGMVKIN